MRKINYLIIHCSDSDIKKHDNIETIRRWHIEENGWSDVGYHYFIRKCGRVERGRSEDEIGAHCKGHNKHSIGICLSGRSEFTEEQFFSAAKLVRELMEKHDLQLFDIIEHNELDKTKTCPNFSAEEIIARINGPFK